MPLFFQKLLKIVDVFLSSDSHIKHPTRINLISMIDISTHQRSTLFQNSPNCIQYKFVLILYLNLGRKSEIEREMNSRAVYKQIIF